MRDKLFETAEGLSPTDTTALHQERQEGSSVSLSWTTFILLVVIACAGLAVATNVIKKDTTGTGGNAKK